MNNEKSICVMARSAFHDNVSQSFRLPAEEGDYSRRCPNPCDYKKNKNGIAVHCGCGWPVSRTEWTAPEGWEVWAEWAEWPIERNGRNNIVIHLSRTIEEAE